MLFFIKELKVSVSIMISGLIWADPELGLEFEFEPADVDTAPPTPGTPATTTTAPALAPVRSAPSMSIWIN